MTTGEALAAALISPNERDSNLEPANVVDGLFAIARALKSIADAIEDMPGVVGLVAGRIENESLVDRVVRDIAKELGDDGSDRIISEVARQMGCTPEEVMQRFKQAVEGRE